MAAAVMVGAAMVAEMVLSPPGTSIEFGGEHKSISANLLFTEQLCGSEAGAKLRAGEPPRNPGLLQLPATPRAIKPAQAHVVCIKDRHFYGFNPMGYRTSLDCKGANYGTQGRWPGVHQTPTSRRGLVQRNPWQLKGKPSVLPAGVWADFPPMETGPGEVHILRKKRLEDAAAEHQIHMEIYRQSLQKRSFESRRQQNQDRYGSPRRAASARPFLGTAMIAPVIVHREMGASPRHWSEHVASVRDAPPPRAGSASGISHSLHFSQQASM
eukprot:scaffold31783_cov129-Isochrysis_galbana.AAC.1